MKEVRTSAQGREETLLPKAASPAIGGQADFSFYQKPGPGIDYEDPASRDEPVPRRAAVSQRLSVCPKTS